MSDPFIAMLALEKQTTLFSSQIVSQIKTMFPDFADKVEPLETDVPKVAAGEAVMFQMMGVPFTVMFMDVPLPDGTLDQAIATNRIWPTAKQDLARHRAHVIVAPLSSSDAFEVARRLARLTTLAAAAIADLTTCIGVYWAAGDTVSESREFVDAGKNLASDETNFPLAEWIQYQPLLGKPKKEGELEIALITTGLLPFIGRELEFLPTAMEMSEIGPRVIGIAAYLLTNGMVVNDGDSIGISEHERIRMIFSDTGHRRGLPVIKLVMERADMGAEQA